ncbi:MAG TPA: sensor histidine kinase [Verrucomicrobiae bacterium]|nr:sensor histidine kinase [Verrucomicrobiae bacterium]
MPQLIARGVNRSRPLLVVLTFAIVTLVGLADYLTGYEVSFSVFYLLAVSLAVWFVGTGFGILISVISTVIWLTADLTAGAHYRSPLVPIWNAMIALSFFLIVVWLLASLRSLHAELEERVRQRTTALTAEMAERERLTKELLKISEREQRRIGQDLHDSVCQHFTATALAGQVLKERLAARSLPEAADAGKIVALVENGITLTRNLSRGLYPVELEAEGLMAALRELVAHASEQFKVDCRLECEQPVPIHDVTTATHLYRIAQEAITNAVKHGRAKRVVLKLSRSDAHTILSIMDDGVGLPDPLSESSGMGLRIMAHRSNMIGGALSVRRADRGGTIVTCTLP